MMTLVLRDECYFLPENGAKKEPFSQTAEKLSKNYTKIRNTLTPSDAVVKEREGLFIVDQVLRRHVLFHLP